MADSDSSDALELSEGSGAIARLRLFFLAPLTMLIVAAVGLFAFEFYARQQEDIQSGVVSVPASVPNLRQDSVRHNAVAQQAIIEMLEKNKALRAALEHGDREALLEKRAPFYADMRRPVVFSGMIALAAGGMLFGFFCWQVGRIGTKLESQRRILAELAMRDGLTNLLNHRMFYTLLEKEVRRTQRYEEPLSLLMLDIDHFKHVNDTHGHAAGDRVIAGLSRIISGQVRSLDSVCRYGGEELSVILPATGVEGAAQVAERIRSIMEKHGFDIGQGQSINITVSIGIASLPSRETSVGNLVATADKALCEAKEGGRNKVCRG